ncbi:integral membrane protein [Prauserella shujinwangii]|uniref:Integral membrane protein n=1 Tax=Prauserella shujinwangii TaxID=1453103 RepID=A0A2T0M370_9PSEU|nr:DUF3817 domain-containing protein [Prauserella shujinwangii]PRX51177.1 integral membrane protein [Prauserella shujinwangii]
MVTTERDGTVAPAPAVGGALARFRVAAFVTGLGLLGLVAVMVLRYGFGDPEPSAVYSPIHGVIYMIYLVVAVDLALKARFSVKGTVAVLAAGCVPFLSFYAERKVTQRVRAGRRL